MSDLTIIVPIHDPQGKQEFRIKRLCDSIESQTSREKNVIFAAKSFTYGQLHIINDMKSSRVQILKNDSESAAQNLNFLLDRVETEFTKILFQDDFFSSTSALIDIERGLKRTARKWLVHGSQNYDENRSQITRQIIPRYREGVLRGINSVGAPSVVAFQTDVVPRFHEDLAYMFDCEWYAQMKHVHGKPAVIRRILVNIAIHPDQATSWAQKLLQQEIEIVRKRHAVSMFRKKCRNCLSKKTL